MSTTRTVHRRGAALAVVLALAAWARPAGATSVFDDRDAGWLGVSDTALDGSARRRGAGPLLEGQAAADGRSFLAVRPFYATAADPTNGARVSDFLWPLGSSRRNGDDLHWRILLLYGDDFDTSDPRSRYRTVLFPILFWGRDKQGEGYFACFPLGGTLHEYLMQDRIAFVLFPLYARSELNDLRTTSVLWPIFSSTRGPGVRRWRVFPFYGKSVRDGRWTKTFALWPIWTSARYEYPNSRGRAFVLFPLFGRTDLTDQQGWTVLPPFFRWAKSDRLTRLECPWPFYQYASGRDLEKLYLWPFWGHKEQGPRHACFWAWPIGYHKRAERVKEVFTRTAVLPFFYYESAVARAPDPARHGALSGLLDATEAVASNAAPGTVLARYVKVWPLVSYRREGEASRWRALELWPLKDTGPVERSWAPLWTLYRQAGQGAAREQELLWGLYRRRVDADGGRRWTVFPVASAAASADGSARRWSVLMGLLGHERDRWHSRWRVLYFLRFGAGGTRMTEPPPDDMARAGSPAGVAE